ncbi:MAG: NAD(P)H-dependent oxidoreductase, partial [Actinobacteria bacterium]
TSRMRSRMTHSPVFFATVPARLKALYDRCQPYWARVYVQGRPKPLKRPAALLLARGGQDPYGFTSAIDPTRSVLSVVGFEVVELLEVEGVDSPSDIGRHADALARARAIGAELAGRLGTA